jgi:hypothetical protein
MSRPGPGVVTIAWCALMSACGPTTPSSAGLEGQWSGTTSQGTPITFTVASDQKVTAINIGYSFNGCSGVQTFSNLHLEIAPMVTCIPGPCSTPLSSYRAFSYAAGSTDGPFTTVNGLFTVTTRAEGQAAFRDYPGCGTAVGIAWSATKP